MHNAKPTASTISAPCAATHVDTCAIFDASTLLYQPAVRAAVVQEQVALLATRLAVARWTSGNATPVPAAGPDAPPYRAAFYAQAQQDFFAWIGRGGVWEADGGELAPHQAGAVSGDDAATSFSKA